jgi:acetyltransferase
MWRREVMMSMFRSPPRWRPCPSRVEVETRIAKSKEILYKAVAEKRSFLSERESKQLLKLYGIPVVEAFLAKTNDEASHCADRIGYPVVLKVESPKISHKSDIGGVVLGLNDRAAVRKAFSNIKQRVVDQYGEEAFCGVAVQKMVSAKGIELIIGSSIDSQFGPIILFGSGGIYVEAFKDSSLGLPPLNSTLARRMIDQTKISKVLANPRGGTPVPLEPIEDLLIALSELVLELPEVAECDMNPILASSSGVFCLDARIVISLPTFRVMSAYAPYHVEYMRELSLSDGRKITIRPVRPEDSSLMAELHDQLSAQSDYKSLFASELFTGRLPAEVLSLLCWSSCDRTLVLVAESEDRQRSLAGVCVLFRHPSGELSSWVAVDQRYPRQEVEQALVSQAEVVAEREGVA